MISEADIGWLAGMFDGEGSVSIVRQIATNGPQYKPQLSVGGTHAETRERIKELLTELGVSKIYDYDQKVRDIEKHKPSWHVRVMKWNDALIVANALIATSTTKRDHWGVVQEFSQLRKIAHKRPYSQREHELFALSTELNRRGPV